MLKNRLYTYEVYGLIVASEFEMQELKPCNDPASIDVTVRFAELGLMHPEAKQRYEFSDIKQVIVLPIVAAFVLDGRSTVWVEPRPGVSNELLAVPFLGPILAILLHMRRRLVLHGSAIKYNGKAYGFVGDKGAGKSTIAAMLLKNPGVQLLTDDLLVLSDALEVLPGYQQLKLSDEALQHSDSRLVSVRPPPIEEFPKHQVMLKNRESAGSVPIAGVFELRRGGRARIEDVSIADGIRILHRFSYVSRFSKREFNENEMLDFFRMTTKIAGLNRVKRLHVPDRISVLHQVINALELMS